VSNCNAFAVPLDRFGRAKNPEIVVGALAEL
jgi:hypothetical protein